MSRQDKTPTNPESYLSRENYQFNPMLLKWQLSRDVLLNIQWIDELLGEPLRTGAEKAFVHIARTYSAHHTKNIAERFKGLVTSFGPEGICTLTATMLVNFRSSLDAEHEFYLGALSGFLKRWYELGYAGLEDDVPEFLRAIRLKGNIKGRAVQTRDPFKGPLTDMEYESLQQGLLDAFENDGIDLESYVLVMLFMVTGRRPSQLADLKAKDFLVAKSSDGLKQYILNIPRRKQQGYPWRSEFKPVELIDENGQALHALLKQNKTVFQVLQQGIPESLRNELPVFPLWSVVESEMMDGWASDYIKSRMESENFHVQSQHLRSRLINLINSLSIHSERTGKSIRVFPTRLRRTLATRAAREGYGSLVIAELLDHSDDQNARVYTENVPEHVNAINEAVARQLAPLAQAFAGMLVDSEEDALFGEEPKNRVRTDSGAGAGTCGHHGFCGALAPISCYTCKFFQPWLDGPHEEVLQGLLAERKRIGKITGDPVMAETNDRTIFAVTQVIQLCEKRHSELCSNG